MVRWNVDKSFCLRSPTRFGRCVQSAVVLAPNQANPSENAVLSGLTTLGKYYEVRRVIRHGFAVSNHFDAVIGKD